MRISNLGNLQCFHDQKGLTLIELVIVLVLIGIVAGFISTVVSYEADTYNKIVNQTGGLQVSRNALQMILRDFRHIMAAESIFVADRDSIQFDLLDDVFVSYKLMDNKILKNGDILMSSVQNLELSYLDTLNSALATPVADPTEIRAIQVSLTTSIDGQSFDFNARVQPRNF